MNSYLSKINYRYKVWAQDFLVFSLSLFAIIFRVHSQLIYEFQRPIFFTYWDFLKQHLSISGGLVDYISAFLGQILEYPLIGALFLSAILLGIAFFTKKITNILWKTQIHTIHWIPGIFLLFLYAYYQTPLSLGIATLIVLIFTWLFIKWNLKSQLVKIGIYTILSGVSFWICGGAFLIFTIFCAIWEWINFKSKRSLFYLLISGLFCIIGSFFSLTSFRQACLHHLPIEGSYPPLFARLGFLLIFPLIGGFAFFASLLDKIRNKFRKIKDLIWVGGTISILFTLFLKIWIGFNSSLTKRLMVFRASRKMDWESTLRIGKKLTSINPHLTIQINRALYYKGHLLDSAFAYPQWFGPIGLLPNRELCFENPEVACELFFELGLISESLHWANESMEVSGQTPEILDRIGLIYLLKGEKETAKMFWRKLKYTIKSRTRAKFLLGLAEEKDLFEKDRTLKEFQSLIPENDFISIAEPSERELLILLQQNPKNRMAFEYLVAYELLRGNLRVIWENINKFKTFGYNRIPRHIQEAVVLYAFLSKWRQIDPLKPYVNSYIFQRFSKFQSLLLQAQLDKTSLNELKEELGDTYWYYWFIKFIGEKKK
ncbi:MAG: DUF6057 family protein [candidate division WOR-3 bacterium]